ncbi:Protein of unknown function [Fontimonas thermophila]|uniref:DUF1329 domain-containing protein n=2 Tax=Fontimonas thermophila TaxID=1076937 RepID=A0A1I2IAA4_9GAMM|nr:Protein of unknown function [Fontimonas thermophila]
MMLIAALALPALARIAEEDAARLGTVLTPLGAERAGTADGVIPEWDGGLRVPPPCFKGSGTRYCDPFADEQPLFTIHAGNLAQYAEYLSAGQAALIRKFPDRYRMPVYATRRTFANPDFVYEAARANATRAELQGNGEALVGAVTGTPFPVPVNGHEVIWNHKTRYRDPVSLRWNNQFAVTASGDYSHTRFQEEVLFAYGRPGVTPDALDNVMLYFLQVATAPPRLSGSILLIHDTLDSIREARRTWQYSPGQGRLRRVYNVGYDSPVLGSDGLRTSDQGDMFNGPMDRYEWKLLGKQRLFVPANGYRLHSDTLRYADILGPHHLNMELTRYELRRVWVVEARLRAGAAHPYKRRRFYVDEDGWQIRVVDLYDANEELWRVQEAHTVVAYDKLYERTVCETVYDLQNNRYLVQALDNEDPQAVARAYEVDHFDPRRVSRRIRP